MSQKKMTDVLGNWFTNEEDGQGLVEYGLLVAVTSVALISALLGFSEARGNLFNILTTEIQNVANGL